VCFSDEHIFVMNPLAIDSDGQAAEAGIMSELQPLPASDASADSVPEAPTPTADSGLFTPDVLRGILLFVAGWMFTGMAIWILLLERLSEGEWSGWHVRDALLTLTAAYCVRGMARFVWQILLYQWELHGKSPAPPLLRNLGEAAWQLLAIAMTVSAFALAHYHVDAAALRLVPASVAGMVAGVTVGIVAGPGLLLLGIMFSRLTNDRTWLSSGQFDFVAPPTDGRGHPPAAIAGMLLVTVLLAPCAEEALFRGVVFTGLRNDLGKWIAVPLSSLIFGLFHRVSGWSAVFFASVIGVACALLLEGSGSLWPAVVAHVLVNSKLCAAYFWSVRESVAHPAASQGRVFESRHT
jgi:membrane protease YdiL (CAAX protease family)